MMCVCHKAYACTRTHDGSHDCAIHDPQNRAQGCRLDSGDLSYLSQEVRKMTTEAAERFDRPFLATTNIVASNDINEESLHSLSDQVCCRSLR